MDLIHNAMKNIIKLKGTFAFFLFMSVSVATFAAGNSTELASLDADLPARTIDGVAPPIVIEKYEYYEVNGCSEDELQHDIKNKCFTWSDGKKYDSLTLWDVTWDHGFKRAPNVCSTASFRVTLEIIFRYPRWTKPDDAPRPLMEKWDHYLKNLAIHENGHRDMAVKAATELTLAVAQLPPAATCDDLNREVRALSNNRMKKLTEEQNEYDKTTDHGVTQGALFP